MEMPLWLFFHLSLKLSSATVRSAIPLGGARFVRNDVCVALIDNVGEAKLLPKLLPPHAPPPNCLAAVYEKDNRLKFPHTHANEALRGPHASPTPRFLFNLFFDRT